MSPTGIKRTIAVVLILSPWIFIPSVFKDIVFIVAGVFLFISTLDLRRRVSHEREHQENESAPKTTPREVSSRSGGTFDQYSGDPVNQTNLSA